MQKQTLAILCYLALTACARDLLPQTRGFRILPAGSRGTLTPYAIDEFGVAVPLIIVLFAVAFWLNRDRVLQAAGESTRSLALH